MYRKRGQTLNFLESYADIYDTLYQEKDYAGECRFILELAAKHGKSPVASILDLGCGTGGHALHWAQKGIEVTGLDLSQPMINRARKKARREKLSPNFLQAPLDDFSLGRTFDLITSMFAVISYQTEKESLLATFRCARDHLEKGALFIFDVWFGPGVLSQPPEERVRRYKKNNLEIMKIVKPVHHILSHRVDVHYDILSFKGEKLLRRSQEIHPMRYFFPLEMEEYARETGFLQKGVYSSGEIEEEVTPKTWDASFVFVAD